MKKVTDLHDAPRLLIEWTPRWQSFVTAIGPALARSAPRLAGETPRGGVPYKKITASFVLQAFLVFVLAILPREIQQLRPYAPPKLKPYEVIYFSGDELPRTEDLGGSRSGSSGRAGGREAYHRTQTIHVARGGSLVPRIVDAPNLRIPASNDAVANLLAFKSAPLQPIPGTPSADGLRSSLRSQNLPANVIAPAPDVAHDQSRSTISLNNAVVPPPPFVASQNARTAPALKADVVPPAPTVRSEHTLYMPVLDPAIIAPSPNVARNGSRMTPSLNANVIAPAPSSVVTNDRARWVPSLPSNVVPPAPNAAGREIAPSRVRMSDPTVVPPPVSAPEHDTNRTAKLTLPAPVVIAPPPSADSSRDLRRLESGTAASASPNVVAPPPTPAANTSFLSSVIGKIFGTQEVVPPPPAVSSQAVAGNAHGANRTLATNVIPPPPTASAGGQSSSRTGRSASLDSNVIPPPPSANASNNGPGAMGRSPSLKANVVAPLPSVAASDSRNATDRNSGRMLMASNVVPPPPNIAPSASVSGRKGTGMGNPGDVGSAVAPPKAPPGSGDSSGVVISSDPGPKVGLPGNAGKGSLALSPAGGNKPGLGGSGGGEGTGRGEGAGSGFSGAGKGVGKTGTDRGTDPDPRAGTSPTPGPGGAGSATTGASAVPGVDVRGGSTSIVTLPSFGSDGKTNPDLPGRSAVKEQQGPAITIVATSRSGGAFDFYGKLPGDNYTVYIDTPIGTVVMQFAEAGPAAHSQSAPLTGPQSLRTDLPTDLPRARMVVKCKLDTSGNLGNFQVLEPGPAAMTAKVMAALPSWKFRPATRGAQPVEVNAILGFNIDTNDRY